jgi:hypothetical protein
MSSNHFHHRRGKMFRPKRFSGPRPKIISSSSTAVYRSGRDNHGVSEQHLHGTKVRGVWVIGIECLRSHGSNCGVTRNFSPVLAVLVHARRLWFDRRRRGVWWVSLGLGGVAFWGQADRGDRTSRAQRGGDPPQLVEAGGFAGDRWAKTR